MLQSSHSNRLLIPFGTFRRSPVHGAANPPRPRQRTVLVLPEGHLDEAVLLFNTAMETAARLPMYRWIFRCHPQLPFDTVRPHLAQDPVGAQTIEASTRASIAEDCERSSVVLYRGSSSVLYGVLMGLKPIYLHHDQHHDIDPLFELDGWRQSVSSSEMLATALERYTVSDEALGEHEWQRAAAYVDGYTIPVDDQSIDRWLAAVGLERAVDSSRDEEPHAAMASERRSA